MTLLLVTSGEPAGIGPDLCLDLAGYEVPLVVLADKQVLMTRATQLDKTIQFEDYVPGKSISQKPGCLTVASIPCLSSVVPGVLNVDNASYVLGMLSMAADRCLKGEFSALVTAPVHKAIINQAGIAFTGHTEFLANYCGIDTVVMMLACDKMKVALMTTHLPLRNVADAITQPLVIDVISCLNTSLQRDFSIKKPKIFVTGLNPHAGEGGHLGREEIEVITPALKQLQMQGIDAQGPFSADTLFTPKNLDSCDVFVAMYHDQGLTVLKYAGYGDAVNITLGLPIIRTSVDHGTALELAGTGLASPSSLLAAVSTAAQMAKARKLRHDH